MKNLIFFLIFLFHFEHFNCQRRIVYPEGPEGPEGPIEPVEPVGPPPIEDQQCGGSICPNPKLLDTDCWCRCPSTISRDCGQNKYFSHLDCSCKCLETRCGPNRVFDPSTCSCKCTASCPDGRTLDLRTCACLCNEVKTCERNFYFNQDTCACTCNPYVRCRGGQFNAATCKCDCQPCPSDKFIQDPSNCFCRCKYGRNIPWNVCPADTRWDYRRCRCIGSSGF